MTQQDYAALTAKGEYVLVDFNATWCKPCKQLAPVLDHFTNTRKTKVSLLKIDADENQQLLADKKIEGIPYLELYHNGKLLWQHSGYIEEADLIKETGLQ